MCVCVCVCMHVDQKLCPQLHTSYNSNGLRWLEAYEPSSTSVDKSWWSRFFLILGGRGEGRGDKVEVGGEGLYGNQHTTTAVTHISLS